MIFLLVVAPLKLTVVLILYAAVWQCLAVDGGAESCNEWFVSFGPIQSVRPVHDT